MTYTEVDKVKELILKAVLPVCLAAAALAVFYPLCAGEDGCDYLKLWLLAGIPFGVHRMFLWIVPKGFDIGGTIGVFVLNLLVGGMIGGVVMVWQICIAIIILTRMIINVVVRSYKRKRVR